MRSNPSHRLSLYRLIPTTNPRRLSCCLQMHRFRPCRHDPARLNSLHWLWNSIPLPVSSSHCLLSYRLILPANTCQSLCCLQKCPCHQHLYPARRLTRLSSPRHLTSYHLTTQSNSRRRPHFVHCFRCYFPRQDQSPESSTQYFLSYRPTSLPNSWHLPYCLQIFP